MGDSSLKRPAYGQSTRPAEIPGELLA
jgi:hypothetical protein